MTPPRLCRECGHADLWQRRDGTCGLNTQPSKAVCRCACVYGDTPVVVRFRESGQYLRSEIEGGAEMTPHRAQAATLTLDGARWFDRRCPLAIDIEVV